MDFFDEHKALIITLLIFSILMLGMYNIKISNRNNEVKEMLVQLQNYDFEELKEQENLEKSEEAPSPPEKETSIETHHAFNQNQEESQKEFQTRLEEIFEENSAQQEASEEGETSSNGEINLNSNKTGEPKKQSDGRDTSKKLSVKSGVMENSSISFNLLGRQAIAIPNPIYTCDTAGKIVVNITVNSRGKVTNTSINEASSSTTNECLTHQAMQYAAGAIFTELAGRNHQLGTITYNFQD